MSELHGGPVAAHNQCRCEVVGRQALSTRAPTGRDKLDKHALRVRLCLVHLFSKQPHTCSISRRVMAASLQHTLQVSASLVSLRTCTESVPQRSSRFTRLNSRKLFSSVVASWQLRCSTHCMYVVPASASASCRQAAASLLHQMEPHGGDFGAAHITDGCVHHLRVVPSSSRKLVPSGGAS